MHKPNRSKIVSTGLALFLALCPAIPSHSQEIIIDLKEVKSLIEGWTAAHNNKNLSALDKYYADEVIFYAKQLPKVSCMGIKSKRLRSKVSFHQQIISQPVIGVYTTGIIKASFIKRVTSGTSAKDYDAYLLLKEIDDKLLIVGESDLIEDGRSRYVLDIGRELKRSRLLMTTPQEETPAEATETIAESEPTDNYQLWLFAILGLTGALGAIYLIFKRFHKIMSTPQRDGRAFEEFIVNRFSKTYFKLLEWRGDKITNGVYALSSHYPDLEVEFNHKGFCQAIAMECKYRRSLFKGKFELERRQFDNYVNFQNARKVPVYVALGLGGRPAKPKDLFIIPLGAFAGVEWISYSDMLKYYNNPKVNFFFDPKIKEFHFHAK